MLKLSISIMMISLSIMMIFLSHPMSMGFFILIQTMLICILSGMMIKTYWFSYILFLIFLGGLLVLFIYMSSIASNELFNFSFKMKTFFILTMMIIMMMEIMLFNNLKWMNLSNSMMESDMFTQMTFFNNENKMNLNKLYNKDNFLMIMMIIYLFIALVAIVKITNIFYGPLRTS